MTIIATITTRPYRPFPFLVRVPEGVLARTSTVDCAHIRTVDQSRLSGRPLATLDDATMARVDTALRISLGLD
ncbi:MAG: hypothetical protein CVT67_09750 [Actinobacteria bacterium HGW-Actinobacteria-7]|nr:MAG: hypothetical protein CVT67_09750 [Actinobacteria bacterium HGW-Actinobacteria-7]